MGKTQIELVQTIGWQDHQQIGLHFRDAVCDVIQEMFHIEWEA